MKNWQKELHENIYEMENYQPSTKVIGLEKSIYENSEDLNKVLFSEKKRERRECTKTTKLKLICRGCLKS